MSCWSRLLDRARRWLARRTGFKLLVREAAASALFVFLAEGVMAQLMLAAVAEAATQNKHHVRMASRSPAFMHYALGSGASYALAVATGASGPSRSKVVSPHAHVNPAVSIAAAISELFEWRYVPYCLVAQCIGSAVGAALVFSVHSDNIGLLGEKDRPRISKRIFAAYPTAVASLVDTKTIILMWDQTWTTAMLALSYLAVYDSRGMVSSRSFSLAPLFVGAALSAIIFSTGIISTAVANPARDFASRLVSFAHYGREVWEEPEHTAEERYTFYFWIPLVVPYVGGLLGSFLYAVAISLHKPFVSSFRREEIRLNHIKGSLVNAEQDLERHAPV